jgi:putative ABC transport system permease protein
MINMLQNYWKIAWRNLLRNKLHTSINIGGLMIGFTIGIAILLVVYHQYTYDGFHANGKRLYQAYAVFNNPEGESINNAFGMKPASAYKREAPAIERITRMLDGGNHIQYKDRDITIPVMMVDEDFLSMFSFPVVKGRGIDALHGLTDVVLTEETAKQIFGNEDPIGRRIKASEGEKMQDLVVSAVVRDPVASSINFQVLARIENSSGYSESRIDWDNHACFVYAELKEGISQREAELELKAVDKKYAPASYTDMAKKGAKPDRYGDLWATRLLPMSEVHFSERVNGHRAMSSSLIAVLLSVGLFIILIACFNFVNISLASAFMRSREIGVRKCLGAARWKLFLQLWGESLLVCAIAFGFSLLLVNVFLHSVGGIQLMRVSLESVIWRPGFIGLVVGLLFLVSLLAGGYPSLMMIRFKVVETLKGKVSLKRKSPLRSGLIVLQFVIACVMISCTLIIYRQYQYLVHADLGIAKEYLISVPLHDPAKGRETVTKLRTRLAADPHIVSVSGSNINLGRGSDHRTVKVGTSWNYKDREIHSNMASVDYDYLKTLGVRLLAGRDFDRGFGTDTSNSVVISESVARQFTEKDLIGKTLGADSSGPGWHVIGVFPDFHLYTMEEAMEPLTLTLDARSPIPYCFVKTTGGDPLGAMQAIRSEMAVLEPGQDFNGSFVDENIDNWYTGARTMSLLFSIAAGIAIGLSCSGLLALVLLIVQQRRKEIGVRKVLGASVRSISLLISREFLWLVLLGVVIATPIAWLLMNKFLEHFAYRITITVWMFALVGAAAMGIALVTIGFNTIRAARQNPVRALRTE